MKQIWTNGIVFLTCTEPCCCPWASVWPSWTDVPGAKIVVKAPPGMAWTEYDDWTEAFLFPPCCWMFDGGMYVVIGKEWPVAGRAVIPVIGPLVPDNAPTVKPWLVSICCEVKIPPRSYKRIENSNELEFHTSVNSIDKTLSSCIKSNILIKAMELFLVILLSTWIFSLLNVFVAFLQIALCIELFKFIPNHNNLYPDNAI